MSTLKMAIVGQELPLHATTAKNGNVFFAFRKPNGKFSVYGEKIPALDEHLPVGVEIEGQYVGLAQSTTEDGRAKVSGRQTVTIEEDGEKVVRQASVTISVTKDGAWNLKASVNRPGGGGSKPINDLSAYFA